jgi:hypothetical protein
MNATSRCEARAEVILPTFSGHPKEGILPLVGVFHETQAI